MLKVLVARFNFIEKGIILDLRLSIWQRMHLQNPLTFLSGLFLFA